MVHSRLPIPSLLCLFGALLILSPELLMGVPEDFIDLPLDDSEVRNTLAFAVEQYNEDRSDSANYFKLLRTLRAQSQALGRDEYRLTVELRKTTCTKMAGRRRKYKWIQRCHQHPEDQEIQNCYFVVTPHSAPHEMRLSFTDCT